MGEIRVRRLEPIHDPEAYDRAIRILGNGLRRALTKLSAEEKLADRSRSAENCLVDAQD